jgi:hypothetical protein
MSEPLSAEGRDCTHPKPEFRWDGKQWGWVCPLCSTALAVVEAARLADVEARLAAVEAALRDPANRWWHTGGTQCVPFHVIRAALHPDPSEART